MPETYRAALLGLGGISRAHLRGYLAPENAERIRVVAGADISEEARQRFAAETGIERVYADYRELLERERPDVVSVCTWPPLHPEMVEAAAAAGAKGIVCEKPMAVDLAGCDRMIAAAERAGCRLIVGHQRRFLPKYARARALIEDGAIGMPVLVNGICGGDLLTDGTHAVDMMRFLLGDPAVTWVMGGVDIQPREKPVPPPGRRVPGFQPEPGMRFGHHVEAGAIAMLQFAGGIRGLLETGICARPGYQRMLVYGTEGQIEVCGDRPVADEPPLRARVRGRSDWLVPDNLPEVNAFGREIAELLVSIEQGTPHLLDAASARATIEVLMAVFESARRRARIDLPLNVRTSPLEEMMA